MPGEVKRIVQDVLQLQWGWITPGTGDANRHEQSDAHFAFLAAPATPHTRHFLLTHCGWWLDRDATPAVRDLTGRNPEPNRHVTPCGPEVIRRLRRHMRGGRLDFAVYPYAACVAEATTGEGLLRSLRMSRDIAARQFGRVPRAVLNHDFTYNLDWGAAQMPAIARLLGFDVILAMEDGLVRGPDGVTLRVLGRTPMREIMHLGTTRARPVFHPLELTQNITFHRYLPEWQREFPALAKIDFRAVPLEEYLRRVPATALFDSREMGAKSWYGGTIDSLVQEQNAKSVEIRLPAIEALALLAGRPETAARLTDLWKKSFILMDNHTLWQCHNYKAHYLPESFKLAKETAALEATLLRPAKSSRAAMVFNPTPWARDLVVEDGARTLRVPNVPGWGARAVARVAAPNRTDRDTRTLANERVTYKLNARGEVVEARTAEGVRRFGGLGRLMRIHESGRPQRRIVRAGATLHVEGALSAATEINLRGNPQEYVTLEIPDLVGAAFLLQAERLDVAGNVEGTEWINLHSLHWGGAGLPRHRMAVGPRRVNARGAVRLRLTLWMLGEGAVSFGHARVWTGDEAYRDVREWAVTIHYRNAYALPRNAKARVVRCGAAMKTVRFTGALPDVRFEMDVSLREGSPVLEYALRLHFPKPTPLGLRSPPFTAEDGSLLGAECERPYLPGLTVLLPLPGPATYFADKPYFIQPVLKPAKRTWHTDVRDWWLEMSPFIGMNLAAADWGRGQVGLLTRGIKHFFRWRRDGEMLGLSLGASLIHPSTQGHSAPPRCVAYDLVKRVDHNPYQETPFLYAHGEYRFHYGICLASSGERGRLDLWRRAQEFALPVRATPTRSPAGSAIDGVAAEPASVVVTALEPRDGAWALRIVNMAGRRVRARIRVPGTGGVRASLAPWAVREFVIRRKG